VDDEPVLSIDGEIEVAVSSTDAGVERDAQPRVLFAPYERVAGVTNEGAGSQIPLPNEALHFVDERLVARFATVDVMPRTQLDGLGVAQPGTPLLRDPIHALLDLHPHRGFGRQGARRAVVANAQLAAKLDAVDLFPITAQVVGVVVATPDRVAAEVAVGVVVEAGAQLGAHPREHSLIDQVLELVPVERADRRKIGLNHRRPLLDRPRYQGELQVNGR
jgi:hypothetical protein